MLESAYPTDATALRERLILTEQALAHERQHSAFLVEMLLGRRVPVQPCLTLRARCSAFLVEMLAGPGRG